MMLLSLVGPVRAAPWIDRSLQLECTGTGSRHQRARKTRGLEAALERRRRAGRTVSAAGAGTRPARTKPARTGAVGLVALSAMSRGRPAVEGRRSHVSSAGSRASRRFSRSAEAGGRRRLGREPGRCRQVLQKMVVASRSAAASVSSPARSRLGPFAPTPPGC
jgi:hypothetical protein